MKRALAGMLFILFSSSRALRADNTSIQFVPSYNGSQPEEFASLLAQVKVSLPSALALITEEWQLPNTLHHPVLVMITDNASTLPGRPVAAFVRSVRAGDELRQELVVDLTHHRMYPSENLDSILTHEMAHLILQDAVISPTSTGIPQWFNEGLAQTVTSEGHERTEEAFKNWAHTDAHEVLCDLNGHIDAFYHGEYNFGCYTQYYLAVRRLTAKGGDDCIARIIEGLRKGIPLPTLITEATGLDWTDFQMDVAQYTREVMDGQSPIP